MLFAVFVVMQLAGSDSTYSSPGLRQLVAEAAAANRVPRELAGYQARLESELARLVPDARGLEHVTQLEQVASTFRWTRDGELEQHIVGYRSRGELTLSTLTLLRRPWALPTLYGNRLNMVFASRAKTPPDSAHLSIAVHPLAEDRDSVYRFSGGDTVLVLHLSGRSIPLVRVRVTPRPTEWHTTQRLLLFRGDLFIDAERKQIVRMRGQLDIVDRHPSLASRVLGFAVRAYLFMDVIDAEFEQRYWLPTYQRIELHFGSSLSENFRPVFRVVTRFRDQQVDTGTVAAFAQLDAAAADTSDELSFAPGDSVDAFHGWQGEIGAEAAAVTASDFDNVASHVITVTGRPRLDWSAQHLFDVFRYDKIEGMYTGAGARLRFRDAAPGLSLVGHAGWAWAEQTARGGTELRWQRDRWQLALGARRELDNTNDFVPVLEGPATFGAALVSIDDYDYVARTGAGLSVVRALDVRQRRTLRLEIGPARDAAVHTHMRRGLLLPDSVFRANRVVAEGGYVREAVTLDINPAVSGDFLEPGVGFALAYQRAAGQLRWQRVDTHMSARHGLGRFTVSGRADAAALFGGSPPQQVIEFGENEGMPGYGYKEFGGDRALLLRGSLRYSLPWLTTPIRLRHRLTLPGAAPTLVAAIQGGWAEATAPETRAALASFGYRANAAGRLVLNTRPTDGARASVAFSVDFFGGSFGVGVARPIDHAARWMLILGSAQF